MAPDQGPELPISPRLLKRDLFGAVELWDLGELGPVVLRRRLLPGEAAELELPWALRWLGPAIGRWLERREQRCLLRLDAALIQQPGLAEELAGRLPRPIGRHQAQALQAALLAWGRDPAAGRPPGENLPVARTFVPGTPLQQAERLSRSYFEDLERLVKGLHQLGLRHNDLHKEPNLLVREDGSPALIDFQLASWHAANTRSGRIRAAEDLRHVRKHARRYWTQAGRLSAGGPLAAPGPRSRLARLWMRYGKPLYRLLTRGLWRWRDGELPRPKTGPWPQWID